MRFWRREWGFERGRISMYSIYWVCLLATLGAHYPSWVWYARRLEDGGDEPLGLFALVLGLGFVAVRGLPKSMSIARFLGASLCVLLSLVDLFPPLVRAFLGIVSVSCFVIRGPGGGARFALLSLSLPLVSSLQFYLGYPLRLAIGAVCGKLLGLLGYAVEARGAVLQWRGELVIIDAPCSGVQMIWMVAVFSSALSCWLGLRNWNFLRVVQWAGAWVFVANVLRNTLLFLLESNIWGGPEWFHDAIGIVLFLGVLSIVYVRAVSLRSGQPEAVPASGCVGGERWGLYPFWIHVCVCAAVFFLNLSTGVGKLAPSSGGDGDWAWSGMDDSWERVPLTDFEARYVDAFPGRVASFRDGDRSMILREVDRPTRMLHSAADCYRATGYRVTSLPIVKMLDGRFWGCSSAVDGTHSVVIRERIVSADGQSWTDVSSWYWSAIMGGSAGPWYAVTEIDRGVRP